MYMPKTVGLEPGCCIFKRIQPILGSKQTEVCLSRGYLIALQSQSNCIQAHRKHANVVLLIICVLCFLIQSLKLFKVI